jgi:predicted AlkP superfamily phosphohydrolase/phosphomutase
MRTRVATSFVSFDDVDWSRTAAYSFGSCGQIFLNLRGREREGIVEPGAEAERLLGDIADRLRQVRDPETGRQLITHVWRPQDLFDGPAMDDAPDLLFPIDDYARDASLRFGIGQPSFLAEPESWTRGAHRMDGVFIAAGPDIVPEADVRGMALRDVAPTALHVAGLPVPDDMDGRVVTEILSGAAAARTPQHAAPGPSPPAAPADAPAPMTDEEQQAVEERLRDLGYLD